MRVDELTTTITLEKDEVSTLAYSLYHDLKSSIDGHYNTLQQSVDGEPIFHKQERLKIYLMQEMFSLIGYRDVCESFMREFAGMFEKKRKERAKEE